MAHTVTSQLYRPTIPAVSGMGAFVTTLFLAWGALVIVLGARGAFITTPGAPPLGLRSAWWRR